MHKSRHFLHATSGTLQKKKQTSDRKHWPKAALSSASHAESAVSPYCRRHCILCCVYLYELAKPFCLPQP